MIKSWQEGPNRPENMQPVEVFVVMKLVFLVFRRSTQWRSHLSTSDGWVPASCQTKTLWNTSL